MTDKNRAKNPCFLQNRVTFFFSPPFFFGECVWGSFPLLKPVRGIPIEGVLTFDPPRPILRIFYVPDIQERGISCIFFLKGQNCTFFASFAPLQPVQVPKPQKPKFLPIQEKYFQQVCILVWGVLTTFRGFSGQIGVCFAVFAQFWPLRKKIQKNFFYFF